MVWVWAITSTDSTTSWPPRASSWPPTIRELTHAIRWRHRTAGLQRLLPGVYAAASTVIGPDLLIAAVARGLPGAVLTGAAAARVTYWPGLDVPVVTVAGHHQVAAHPRIAFSRRRIPPALLWHLPPDPLRTMLPSGLRCTTPALTTWDLVEVLGSEAVDEVLRRRGATLAQLTEALELTTGRRGNVDRRRILLDSQDEPWSPAERKAHRLCHRAGFTPWRANHLVIVNGRRYRLDLAWPALRLAVEIDGRRWHSESGVFESDRQRQNDLVLAGWTVIRLTWAMLADEDNVIDLLTRIIRQRERQFSVAR